MKGVWGKMSVQKDLESLLNTRVSGDITYLVNLLLKDSKHKEELFRYDYLLIDKDIIAKIKKGAEIINANIQEGRDNAIEEDTRRPTIERWLSSRGVSDDT